MPKNYSFDYFENEVKKDFLNRRNKSIESNKEHNEYVCLLANNFYGQCPLVLSTGFKTAFLEPLFDSENKLKGLQSKNFDIMLHNKERKQTIFVEVKSSIGSIKELLSDFEEAKEIVKRDFDKFLAEKTGLKFSEHNLVEFVLLIPREQSIDVKKRIRDKNITEIIVWELPTITSPSIEVRHEIYDEDEMISKKCTHLDKSFREKVYGGLRLTKLIKMFNFLLNSDPYQKIEYFIPLFKNLELKKFNFDVIKNRILDGDMSFSAYMNPEIAKEFVYRELVKNLSKINGLKTIKKTENILTDEYELTFDKRLTENILKQNVKKTFFESYIKEKEIEIKKEALEMHHKYNGQTPMSQWENFIPTGTNPDELIS